MCKQAGGAPVFFLSGPRPHHWPIVVFPGSLRVAARTRAMLFVSARVCETCRACRISELPCRIVFASRHFGAEQPAL